MKLSDVKYSDTRKLEPQSPSGGPSQELDNFFRYMKLAPELGYADEAKQIFDSFASLVRDSLERFNEMALRPKDDPDEPETISEIKALRPQGVRRLRDTVPPDYEERFLGALLGRGAGVALGGLLEFVPHHIAEPWARYNGDDFPLTDYWSRTKSPGEVHYLVTTKDKLTKGNIDCLPVDDDTGYTLLGLLVLENHGPDFTLDQLADVWKEQIPLQDEQGHPGIYWGERIFLQNLLAGVPPARAGYLNNPNVQSIAAWTRADTWGYVCPGWPERAAEFAFKDASANHRRNGVYGEMFFSAAIAAAFAVDDPRAALEIGLQEIPENCMFAEAVSWTLDIAPRIQGYRDGFATVMDRYGKLFYGSGILNGVLCILGILLGGRDFTKVIGETVGLGMDNDCTTGTAGSIVGAVIGKSNIPEHWWRPFNNRFQTFYKQCPRYIDIDELEARYHCQAERIFKGLSQETK